MNVRCLGLVAAMAATLASATGARADTAPKPNMWFTFTFDRPGVTIAKGVLLQCDAADCAKAMPLQELGPQVFRCDATTCSATAYGFSDFSQLRITLSDGRTVNSNVFSSRIFSASFRVVVSKTGLAVSPLPE